MGDGHPRSLLGTGTGWVGVLPSGYCHYLPLRELLLFDRLAVLDLDLSVSLNREHVHGDRSIAASLERLAGDDVLVGISPPSFEFFLEHRPSTLAFIRGLYEMREDLRTGRAIGQGGGSTYSAPLLGENVDRLELAWLLDQERSSLIARATADHLRYQGVTDVVSAVPLREPLARLMAREHSEGGASTAVVLQIILQAVPQPSQQTSLESILAFREDESARQKLRALRLWIREVAGLGVSPNEVKERLEWLVHEYTRALEIHRVKWETGMIESFITTTLEVAENLVTLRWSHAAKALFSLKRRKLALLEAEASAPGREVAYVAALKEKLEPAP